MKKYVFLSLHFVLTELVTITEDRKHKDLSNQLQLIEEENDRTPQKHPSSGSETYFNLVKNSI